MTNLVGLVEMAKILGVSKNTFRNKYLLAIEKENCDRNTEEKLFITTNTPGRVHRRFHPDRVQKFILSKKGQKALWN